MDKREYSNISLEASNLYKKIEKEYYDKVKQDFKNNLFQRCFILDGVIAGCKKFGLKKDSELNKFIKKLIEVNETFKRFNKELDEPFLLFVMGMGKMGKSTLINALLEEKIAQEGTLPSTLKIDLFLGTNNANKSAEILYKDGRIENKSFQEARDIIEEHEKKTKESKKLVNETLKEIKKTEKNPKALKEAKQKLKEDLLVKSDISEVRWEIKRNEILDKFTIVDTPGLQQELFGEVHESAWEYYHKSDGAIWIIDGNKLASKEQKELIENINSRSESKKQKIIGVINRIDLIRKNGGEEAVQKVCQEAKRIYGDIFDVIVPISAKEAIDGLLSNDENLIDLSNIKTLKSHIIKRFYTSGEQIKVQSKIEGTNMLSKELSDDLDEFWTNFKENTFKLKKITEEFKKALEKKKHLALKKVENLINDYKKTVKENIENKTETYINCSSDDRKKNFSKIHIFNEDSLKIKIEYLNKEINDIFIEELKYYQDKLKFTKYKHINEYEIINTCKTVYDSYVSDFTKILLGDFNNISSLYPLAMYSVASALPTLVMVMPIAIIGGAVLLIGEAIDLTIGFFSKSHKIKKAKEKFREELNTKCSAIKNELEKNINNNFEQIINYFNKSKNESFEWSYCKPEHIKLIEPFISSIHNELKKNINDITLKDVLLQKNSSSSSIQKTVLNPLLNKSKYKAEETPITSIIDDAKDIIKDKLTEEKILDGKSIDVEKTINFASTLFNTFKDKNE